MIKIATDSSANITQKEAVELGITVIPLGIIFGSAVYEDGIDITTEEFYKKLTSENEFPHTSQPTREAIEILYKTVKESGDTLIFMPISDKLSATYESAVSVKESGGYDNVYVYNTLCTTVMLRLLVLEAVKYSNQTPNVILEHLNGVRSRLTLYAAIDTLEYLKKGGRLKAGAATVGTLLNIKPIVTVNGEGEVEIAGKQIGFKKALNFILEKIKSMPIDENYPIYFIYSMAEKNCDALIRLSGTSGEKYNISAVIGAHIGAGAAGIAYVRKTV